jgi:hypothetical protein
VTFGWPEEKLGPFKITGPELDAMEIAIREARGKARGSMTVSPINNPNQGPTQIIGR